MSDRQGIEIDYCPECRGVWLDRGELDKIIERSNPSVAHQQTTHVQHGSRHGSRDQGYGHGKKKKRESLLSELFDF